MDTRFEVVVIGGGMAGLVAGLAAAEQGAAVTLFEKAPTTGGNARYSGGMFLGARDFAALSAYIPDGDPRLQRLFCDDYDDAVGWLEAHGLPLAPPVEAKEFRRVRPMAAGRPGARDPFVDLLAETAAARGVTIHRQAAVTGLERDGDAWRLALRTPAGDAAVMAGAVVVATGGFAASRELLAKYHGPAGAALRPRSLPGASGDGLRLALAAGAATNGDMRAFYGHTMADCALEPAEWQPMTPYFSRFSVLVNRGGRRFVDESSSFLEEAVPQAGYRQPGGLYWLLFNDHVRSLEESDRATEGLPRFDWLALARQRRLPIVEAASLEALAASLAGEGVDEAALIAEIARYNAACRGGTASHLTPSKREHAVALDAPPFGAMRCVAGITATCGGIAIDENCRVLDGSRRTLPGLYAAGVDAGGVYGKTYGGFLSWSVVSGRRAGRNAAGSRCP